MSHILSKSQENGIIDAMDRLVEQSAAAHMKRRRFITSLAATGAAVSLAGMAGCSENASITTTTAATPPGVTDVLNFALNLEYLEASFYLYVTTGSGLAAADMGSNPGTVTGGAKVAFVNPYVISAAAQLATDEREHVEFLRTTIAAIGGTPVSMPNINLAANGAVTSDATFLSASRQFENVGISAYIGGAQYLVSNTTALTYAAQILDTEAQHAGFVRELCINLGVTSPAVDSLDNPPTINKIFDTSPTTGLNPVRTTSQVLQIVYGSVGTLGLTKGGFFPNGVNGTITTT